MEGWFYLAGHGEIISRHKEYKMCLKPFTLFSRNLQDRLDETKANGKEHNNEAITVVHTQGHDTPNWEAASRPQGLKGALI